MPTYIHHVVRVRSEPPAPAILGHLWSDNNASPPVLYIATSVDPDVWAQVGGSGVSNHAALSNVTANQHHNQAHEIIGADHTTFPGGTDVFLRGDGTFAIPPSSGGGAASWLPQIKPALALSNRFTWFDRDILTGFAVAQTAASTVRIDQKPALALSNLSVQGTLVQPNHTPALDLETVISEFHINKIPAAEIVQVTYSLTRRVGADAQAAVGTAWTTGANATGTNNGTVATSTGGAGAVTHGIELSYLNHVLKDELTITSATLFVYAEVTGDATGLLTHTTLSYNIGAGVTNLEATINGNFANLTTPRQYSLPLLDTWTEYNALQARVVCVHDALSAGIVARLDAIEIQIVATKTDSL